jgi:hypothetical protein
MQPGPLLCVTGVNPSEFTLVLQRIEQGDAQAADRLLPLVYDQLRHLAAARMAHETPGHTLQPTALVHEAWLRLGGDQQPNWKSRAQFFAAAAVDDRHVLQVNDALEKFAVTDPEKAELV